MDQVMAGFDQELLVRRVQAAKLARGVTFARMAEETGISDAQLKWYLTPVKRRKGCRPSQMTMTKAMQFMTWLGEHDIRTYLKEE